ncbi:hypothetical protein RND81_08G043800 [Saponaria officinalis]|uniref:Endonuclease/exonuclease/phosphatase domain-containing protein n=1 Tax=Saponaria officinalis TaxID=3572 RepID=A0AAW1J2C4_SAPOF
MKGLVWNCRGLNNPLAPTRSKIRTVLSMLYFDFIFLMETKCNAENVYPLCRPFGFNNFVGVDAIGSSGGLLLGWKSEARIRSMHKYSNFIFCKVQQCKNIFWYLCLVYGNPSVSSRDSVWSEIGGWLDHCEKPTLLIGDFNQVEFSWDKLSKTTGRIDGADAFFEWRQKHKLFEVLFKGPRFAWCNNREGIDRVYERLDKAYVTDGWGRLFPNVRVKHYPIQLSDHAPIEIDTNLTHDNLRRPYKVQAWNFEYEECLKIVTHSWEQNYAAGSAAFMLARKLGGVRNSLRVWSKEKRREYGKVWSDFDDNLALALEDTFNGGSTEKYNEEHNKVREFSRVAAIYWKQRSKLRWTVDGDTCTKFFFN